MKDYLPSSSLTVPPNLDELSLSELKSTFATLKSSVDRDTSIVSPPSTCATNKEEEEGRMKEEWKIAIR